MKCALCGAEWVERNGHFHPDNACPLSGVCTYRSLVVAINEAIKEARTKGNSFRWTAEVTDPRRPDECKFKDSCSRMVYGHEDCTKENCCPCAAWER